MRRVYDAQQKAGRAQLAQYTQAANSPTISPDVAAAYQQSAYMLHVQLQVQQRTHVTQYNEISKQYNETAAQQVRLTEEIKLLEAGQGKYACYSGLKGSTSASAPQLSSLTRDGPRQGDDAETIRLQELRRRMVREHEEIRQRHVARHDELVEEQRELRRRLQEQEELQAERRRQRQQQQQQQQPQGPLGGLENEEGNERGILQLLNIKLILKLIVLVFIFGQDDPRSSTSTTAGDDDAQANPWYDWNWMVQNMTIVYACVAVLFYFYSVGLFGALFRLVTGNRNRANRPHRALVNPEGNNPNGNGNGNGNGPGQGQGQGQRQGLPVARARGPGIQAALMAHLNHVPHPEVSTSVLTDIRLTLTSFVLSLLPMWRPVQGNPPPQPPPPQIQPLAV